MRFRPVISSAVLSYSPSASHPWSAPTRLHSDVVPATFMHLHRNQELHPGLDSPSPPARALPGGLVPEVCLLTGRGSQVVVHLAFRWSYTLQKETSFRL